MKRIYRSSGNKGADLIERAQIAEDRAEVLRLNKTKSEDRVLHLLNKLGYKYTFQYPIYDEWYFIIADFFLHNLQLCIEVDGESHFNAESRKKEAKRRRWLHKQGIKVLRIKNEATKKLTVRGLQGRIERAMASRKRKKRK